VRAPAAVPAIWWVRVLAQIPLAVLYGVAHLVAWMAYRVVPYRKRLVQASLATAFPKLSEGELRAVKRRYYLRFAQMAVELIKASAFAPAEIRRRVRIVNLEGPQALLAQGQSVLLIAAHQSKLGMDAARPVPRARLPARCRL
jgi:Kdo2-lipid IVA lauroyltransferase/acyltransferase